MHIDWRNTTIELAREWREITTGGPYDYHYLREEQ
ncbi:hypothetical protein PROPHIT492_156 [Mycobacterium phage prophiT49-2]|nr:hypothetical protein PROPHIT492_156 [Mycobacterium phage prophiT49-2]